MDPTWPETARSSVRPSNKQFDIYGRGSTPWIALDAYFQHLKTVLAIFSQGPS